MSLEEMCIAHELVRPLGKLENSYVLYHDHGISMITYKLNLHSKVPLSEQTLQQTLGYLQQSVPQLRLRITEYEDQNHFQFMEEDVVDLEVLEQDEWIETYEDMLNKTHYNTATGTYSAEQYTL